MTAQSVTAHVATVCDSCGDGVLAAATDWHTGDGAPTTVACPTCHREWQVDAAVRAFERCCVCGGTRFYRQKMFPPWLGIGLVVVGAIGSIWTYGLSLVAVFLVDLLIYRLVPEMAVCYQCRAEVRGVALPERVLPFRHHLAAGYEGRRNRWLQRVAGVAGVAGAAAARTAAAPVGERVRVGTPKKADSLTAPGDSEHDPPGS